MGLTLDDDDDDTNDDDNASIGILGLCPETMVKSAENKTFVT